MRTFFVTKDQKPFILIEIDGLVNEEAYNLARIKLDKAVKWLEESYQAWKHIQPREVDG